MRKKNRSRHSKRDLPSETPLGDSTRCCSDCKENENRRVAGIAPVTKCLFCKNLALKATCLILVLSQSIFKREDAVWLNFIYNIVNKNS